MADEEEHEKQHRSLEQLRLHRRPSDAARVSVQGRLKGGQSTLLKQKLSTSRVWYVRAFRHPNSRVALQIVPPSKWLLK